MSILIGLCISVILILAFGYVVVRANEKELDAHEEMTIPNHDNREHWDM